MNNKKIRLTIIIMLGLLVILAGFVFWYLMNQKNQNQTSGITNFEQCAAAGYPIMESYPRQCRTPDGQNFTEDIGNELTKLDLIRLTTPRPNELIKSPLTIKGEARGYWFFEASFPVKLLDANGNQLAIKPAQAQGDWMTNDFVSYEAILEFETPATKNGWLILEKDNPSGLPANADELKIPIKFFN